MRPFRCAGAVLLVLAIFGATTAVAQDSAPTYSANSKRLLVAPELKWESNLQYWSYEYSHSTDRRTTVMGGLTFGMDAEEVSRVVTPQDPELHWPDLPVATEFSEEVRYISLPLQQVAELRTKVSSCFGAPSYVVIMFRDAGLFRISWRFLPDPACPDPREAARDVFASVVAIARTDGVSLHYRTRFAEVVDLSDPDAGPLLADHWQMQGQ